MDYYNNQFPFGTESARPIEQPIDQEESVAQGPMPRQQSQQPFMDNHSHPHSYIEFSELQQNVLQPEEYEDAGEILTRPRLTKEQVEVLESQFQAHPKPNSNVKRQLAMQTGLTLPRVAVRLIWSVSRLSTLTIVTELVPKPTSKSQTAKETRRVRNHASY